MIYNCKETRAEKDFKNWGISTRSQHINMLEAFVNENPNSVKGWQYLAYCQHMARRFKEAANSYQNWFRLGGETTNGILISTMRWALNDCCTQVKKMNN
jgi:cytochrome c-type biogenesis protein CcmH/NrfG